MFTALLEKLVRHEDLTADEAAAAMREVMVLPSGLSTVSWKTLMRSLSRIGGRVSLHFQPSAYPGGRDGWTSVPTTGGSPSTASSPSRAWRARRFCFFAAGPCPED